MDTPPWWHLRKKTTMYYDGRTPAASVRTNMQFLLGEKSLDELKALENDFADIQAYFKSLTPPKYPFAIDRTKAERGEATFADTCSRCHGTYGAAQTYPNKIVPLDQIGTDPARSLGLSDRFVAHYNTTWFAQNHPANPKRVGYQAPPLDGIWATAPYLHNGSVPTLFHLLNSSTRPARFKRPPSTDFAYYDQEKVGWTFERVESTKAISVEERNSVFDASRFGLGNGGHTFGDDLDDNERMELIEYLKTL
jgi:mono/diheme cytochrome c family protein